MIRPGWPALVAVAALTAILSRPTVEATSGSPPALLGTSPAWSVEGGQQDAELGWVVSRAGDVNGDGYDDVVIGAPRFHNGTYEEGRVTLHLGSPAGLSAATIWSAEGDLLGNQFGYAIAGAGDVNGDGYADVLVGAPFYSGWKGRAYLYHGSPAGLSLVPDWIGECTCPGAQYGRAVGAAGDVNGDGYADVIVGAQAYFYAGSTRGAAFVYLGTPGGLSANPMWTLVGPQTPGAFGATVGSAGDVNGDGFGDVVIAAPEYDNVQTDEGIVFVYPGSAAGLQLSPSWMVESDQQGARLGLSVAAVDVNGDGYSDLAVGAPFYDGTALDEGLLQVYYGSPAGLPAAASWSTLGGSQSRWLGFSVSSAGDVDGDGYDDLATGAPAWVLNQRTVGAALVAFGSPAGLPPGPLGVIRTGPNDGSSFGQSVSGAGDVNADGSADLIVGAPNFTNDVGGLLNAGKAFLYLGLPSAVDRDFDGISPRDGDCDDRNALRSARPLEVTNLAFRNADILEWDGQTLSDGSGVTFDLLRSGAAGDFVSGAICVERNDGTDTLAFDPAGPPPGAVYQYLVRAENDCRGATAIGSLGASSAGGARVGLVCR